MGNSLLDVSQTVCIPTIPGYPSNFLMPYDRQGPNGEPLYLCTGCRMWYFADGFLVNRLGFRYKTCTRCCTRERDPARIDMKKAALIRKKEAALTQKPRTQSAWLSDSEFEAVLEELFA